jgi:primosomal replication protein N''
MSTEPLLQHLQRFISELAQTVTPLAGSTWQQARFDNHLFSCKSSKLSDYLAEIENNFQQLSHAVKHQKQQQVTFISERLVSQIAALQREVATQNLRKSEKYKEPEDYYTRLAKHQDYERRLKAMIEDRENQLLQSQGFDHQQRLQKELAALEGRLMRCRKATKQIERQIEQQEKEF